MSIDPSYPSSPILALELKKKGKNSSVGVMEETTQQEPPLLQVDNTSMDPVIPVGGGTDEASSIKEKLELKKEEVIDKVSTMGQGVADAANNAVDKKADAVAAKLKVGKNILGGFLSSAKKQADSAQEKIDKAKEAANALKNGKMPGGKKDPTNTKTKAKITKAMKITPVLNKELKGRGETEFMQLVVSPDRNQVFTVGLRDTLRDANKASSPGAAPPTSLPWAIQLWTVKGKQSGLLVHSFPSERKCWEVSINNAADRILIGGSGRLDLWKMGSKVTEDALLFSWPNPEDPSRVQKFKKQANLPSTFSFCGELVLVGNHNEGIVIYLKDNTVASLLQGHDKAITCMSFLPMKGGRGNSYCVTGTMQGTVILWQANNGIPLSTYSGHSKAIQSLAVSKDSLYFITASDDRTCRIWDLMGRSEPKVVAHPSPVLTVALGPSGNYYVTSAADRVTRVFAAGTKDEVARFEGHKDAVRLAVLYGDDNSVRVATCSFDKIINMWELTGAINSTRDDNRPEMEILQKWLRETTQTQGEQNKKDIAAKAEQVRLAKEKAKKLKKSAVLDAAAEEKARALYKQALVEGESFPWNEVKLILCGPGGSGKSSVAHSFIKGLSFEDTPKYLNTPGVRTFYTKGTSFFNFKEHEEKSAYEIIGKEGQLELEGIDWKKHKAGTISKREADEKEPPVSELPGFMARMIAEKIRPAPEAKVESEIGGAPRVSGISPISDSGNRRSSFTLHRRIFSNLVGGKPAESKPPAASPPAVKPAAAKKYSLGADTVAMNSFPKDEIIQALKQMPHEKDPILVRWFDVGSQDPYDSMNHICMSEDAVYMVCFDLVQMVNSATRADAIKQLEQWLRFVDLNDGDFGAPVFLVGTNKDKVSDPGVHRNINSYLGEAIDFRSVIPALVPNNELDILFWPINNNNSKGVVDGSKAELRAQVFASLAECKFIQQPIPAAWIRILDILRSLKERKVSFGEVYEMAQRYGITSTTEVKDMITRFHRTGNVLHLAGSDILQSVIIIDPQWFVDCLTLVVRLDTHRYRKYFYEGFDAHDLNRDYQALIKEAKASRKLLSFLWKEKTDFLITMTRELNLLCDWRFDDLRDENPPLPVSNVGFVDAGQSTIPRAADMFLVPCLLRDPDDEASYARRSAIDKECPKASLRVVAGTDSRPTCAMLDFSKKFLPAGFFDRLVSILISHSASAFLHSRIPLMIRGTALMSFGLDDFRLDEDIDMKRILITCAAGVSGRTIIAHIDSAMKRLREEGPIEYRTLVVVWRKDDNIPYVLVELAVAQDALAEAVAKGNKDGVVRGMSDTRVNLLDLASWIDVANDGNDEKPALPVSKLPHGKDWHCSLVNFTRDICKVVKDRLISMNFIIGDNPDSAVSICVFLDENLFSKPENEATLRLALSKRIPVVFLYKSNPYMTFPELIHQVLQKSPPDLVEEFYEIDPLSVRENPFFHESYDLYFDITNRVNNECKKLASR